MTNSGRASLAIAGGVLLRALSRARFWLGVAVLAGLVSFGALEAATIESADGGALGRWLGTAYALRGLSLLPLVLPLIAGDLLATDIGSGYLNLLRARGAAVGTVLCGHALGSAGIAATATAIAACAGGLAARILIPPGGLADPIESFPFAARLLVSHPIVHLLLMLSIYALAGTAMLGTAMAVGAWSGSGLSAALISPLALLASGVFLPNALQWINPLERVMFANTWGAPWATPIGLAAYWAGATCLTVLAAFAGVRHRGAAA